MQCQLVIQFALRDGDGAKFEELLALESRLKDEAGRYEVDGHDVGSGELNIFLLTHDPITAFEEIRGNLPMDNAWVAAYRVLDSGDYTILWPPTATSFSIK
jgi:hypothetical protein